MSRYRRKFSFGLGKDQFLCVHRVVENGVQEFAVEDFKGRTVSAKVVTSGNGFDKFCLAAVKVAFDAVG